jgi:hypothetical protein
MTLTPPACFPVQSSLLACVGYDADESILQLQFCDGDIYQYFDVPAVIYEILLAAESKGTCFNHHIRGHFRYALLSRPR